MVNTFLTIMQSFLSVLTGGIVTVGEGVGSGIVAIVTNLMFVTDTTTGAITDLNAFGYTIALMAGISLAIAISKLVYHFIASIGQNGK